MTEQVAIPTGRRQEFTTETADETIRVGAELVQTLELPVLLILRGSLGAGKTTLVKGIVEALGGAERDEVTSPTFTLIHEYGGERQHNGKTEEVSLYHLDLYRLENERQVEQLGIDELLEGSSLVLVEWGEKFDSITRRAAGEIYVESEGGDRRKITLSLR